MKGLSFLEPETKNGIAISKPLDKVVDRPMQSIVCLRLTIGSPERHFMHLSKLIIFITYFQETRKTITTTSLFLLGDVDYMDIMMP